MYKHIKDIIEQCKETSTSYFDGRGNVTEIYFDREKFAELIVRECMEWCDAHATINGTAQKIRDSIKKDFGVEE